jgi:L-ascorbate metabolism protein UlaG (beta-lactamase superfamily)
MGKTQVFWLGQSFIKIITSAGKVIFIDPWKDYPPGNALFPKDVLINDADLILVTHGHLDHLGDTVELMKRSDAKPSLKLVTNFDLMLFLMEQGVPQEKFQAINIGGTVAVDDIKVTMVPAIHSSGVGPFSPKGLVYGGVAGGFVVTLSDGFILYHAGDTDLYTDMKLIGDMYHPNVAFIPIGDVFTMGPKSAAKAAAWVQPKIVVPIHYGGSFKLPGDPKMFSDFVTQETKDAVKTIIMTPGQPVVL